MAHETEGYGDDEVGLRMSRPSQQGGKINFFNIASGACSPSQAHRWATAQGGLSRAALNTEILVFRTSKKAVC